jgi:hypothetical protein
MSSTVIVRYRTTPEAAEENARLIGEVFAALGASAPPGLDYTAHRLADGVTFVHVARIAGPENPLSSLAEFAEFQRDLADRCAEPPEASLATVVGTYTST